MEDTSFLVFLQIDKMMSDKIIEFSYDGGSQKGPKQLQILNFIHHKGFNYDQENLNISI